MVYLSTKPFRSQYSYLDFVMLSFLQLHVYTYHRHIYICQYNQIKHPVKHDPHKSEVIP